MIVVIKHSVLAMCLIFASAVNVFGNKKLTENYLNRYKNMAISEMHRTGIPASIKLAQGILESDLGRSPLASQANNHFGIKCSKDWTGLTYYKHDDDTDSTGTIIESCFRAYESGEQSYAAHSEFLTHPSKQSRYGFLFELATTDYVGWANGLKFAGYASDPSYPSKLIKIIETNRLYEYDEQINAEKITLVTTIPQDNKKVSQKKETEKKVSEKDVLKSESTTNESNDKLAKSMIGKYKMNKINDARMVHAFGGESIKELALRNKKDVYDLLEFNERIQSLDYILQSDEIVYFDKKKKAVEDVSLAFHTVSKGETLYKIAQKYGVRLESIISKNNLPEDAEPLTGELVSLSRNLSKKQSPKYRIVEKFDSFIDFGQLQ
ncbi:MAG: glucosaminidase domain-containing protein [Saprospiraceae bacterium]|nr:glucosaminidase domain-containing protein [Saprospiraceae bacterium]